MRPVAEDVYLIEGLRGSNVYLLTSDAELTLVDAGMRGDGDRIATEIEEMGYRASALGAILVTHAHPDHIGGLGELVRRCGADVVAHREEVPYIEGAESLPAGSMLQRALGRLGGLLTDHNGGIRVTRGVEDGETLRAMDGLEVIHTPGHTPGSMCLYQRKEGVLFTGDLLSSGHPLTGRGGLRYGPQAFTVDVEQMRRSAQRLLGLKVKVLCVGHGEPVDDGASEKMRALLERADA